MVSAKLRCPGPSRGEVCGAPRRGDDLHGLGGARKRDLVAVRRLVAGGLGDGGPGAEQPARGLCEGELHRLRVLAAGDPCKRQQRGRGGEVAGGVVEHLRRQGARRLRRALERGDAGGALHERVEPTSRPPRSYRSPRGQGHDGQVRMVRCERLRVQSEPRQRSGPVALDEHVRLGQ